MEVCLTFYPRASRNKDVLDSKDPCSFDHPGIPPCSPINGLVGSNWGARTVLRMVVEALTGHLARRHAREDPGLPEWERPDKFFCFAYSPYPAGMEGRRIRTLWI